MSFHVPTKLGVLSWAAIPVVSVRTRKGRSHFNFPIFNSSRRDSTAGTTIGCDISGTVICKYRLKGSTPDFWQNLGYNCLLTVAFGYADLMLV